MLSTFTRFTLVNRDLQASLRQVSENPVVARDAQYYRETIGSITSVDDLLDDYRLYSYAMKAHGLEEMTYAKAFMKKVLESDLSDDQSFANQLTDERYQAIAGAFNFGPGGGVAAISFDGQTDSQEDATIGLYSQQTRDAAHAVDDEVAYFASAIDDIGSVDAFMANPRLVEFALKASGIDTRYYSADAVRQTLTSDLSDPQSYANRTGSAQYVALAKAFNFQPDGALPEGASAQSQDQTTTLAADYRFYVADGITPQAAQDETAHFTDSLSGLTSVDDLLGDDRLYSYLLTAFEFDPYKTDKTDIRAALLSDPGDPDSFANTSEDTNYSRLAGLFAFDPDGSLPDGEKALSDTAADAVRSFYLEHYDDAAEAAEASRTDYYKSASEQITSVGDLTGDSRLLDYVLTAYDLDPDDESRAKIEKVLTSDTSDPSSYANRLSDDRYQRLAAAFNFTANGFIDTPRRAQSEAATQDLAEDYVARVGTGEISRQRAEEESRYYTDTIGSITSLDQFLDDGRLVDYALEAKGIDATSVTTDFMRKVLTSDVNDPESFASSQAGRGFRDLAAIFNFTADGTIARQETGTAQSRIAVLKTGDMYIRQTLEENEGAENAGVRLALYFERKASEITSAYDILADPALQQVVQTALGLSSQTSAADIDVQAATIESRIDLADFQDPDKVTEFLSRFSVFYDTENSVGTSSAATLLSGSSGTLGISADLMLSLAQLQSSG